MVTILPSFVFGATCPYPEKKPKTLNKPTYILDITIRISYMGLTLICDNNIGHMRGTEAESMRYVCGPSTDAAKQDLFECVQM